MPRRTGTGEIVTIFWRDIPAQVNGQAGRSRHQVLLSAKFQRAVDRAKRRAGIRTADADIAQWHRVSVRCDGDVVAAADAEAARLEAAYSRDYLGKLAFASGVAADVADTAIGRAELLALEELADEELADDDAVSAQPASTEEPDGDEAMSGERPIGELQGEP